VTTDYATLKGDCIISGAVEFSGAPPRGARKPVGAQDIVKIVHEVIRDPLVAPAGLHFCGYEIIGILNIGNLALNFPIYFEHCTMTDFLEFSGIKCSALGFQGCILRKGIDLRNARVHGYVLMNNNFTCHGPLLMRDAKIEGSLEFQTASFLYSDSLGGHKSKDADGECCSLSRVSCDSFYWMDLAQKPKGKVNLRDMTTRSFRHKITSDRALDDWPDKGKLILDGFNYQRFDECSPQQALKWLNLQDRQDRVTINSLSNLAKAYTNEHQKQSAQIILSQLKRAEIQRIQNPFLRWINFVIFWFIGFGAQLQKPLAIFVILVLMHFSATLVLRDRNMTQPNINDILTEDCLRGPSEICKPANIKNWKSGGKHSNEDIYLPKGYPDFNAALFTTESVFPFFDFHQRKYWEFSNPLINFLMTVISTFSLFISGVFVGGITGILTVRAE